MSTLDTANAARGRWPGILQALGIDSKFLKNEHGPCPICSPDKASSDRFRFDDNLNGSWICNQCGAGDGFVLLQKVHGWDFKKAASEVDRVVGNIPLTSEKRPERTEEDKRRYMGKIWRESRPVQNGDPVWLYLTRRCGDVQGILDHIRFHPALKHSVSGSEHPAMLAGMGWDGKKFSGIHRTYLTEDGQKAQVDPVRMSFGEVGPVRLGPAMERLGIAEGIETAICASHRFGLPVWSAICANGMEAWEPPEGVKAVLICGDNDESMTGQAAAFALAKRLRREGLEVQVAIPETVGCDWADAEMGRTA